MKELYNLFLFLVICLVVYIIFRNFNYVNVIEGMTDASSGNTIAKSSNANGIAGNAASYAASLKSTTIKLQDTFLIKKYRSDYESAILNLDDLISNLMLKTALSVNQENPEEAVEKLGKMQQAKVALNSVMKFVDSQ
jgi:hypothetical protein